MFRGGAERLILIMARGLNADIATGFWSDSETFPKNDVPNKLFILGRSSQKSGWRYLKFQFLFYFKSKFIKNYDLIIFSGNNCLSAAHNAGKGIKKIFYCHTPVRHAYDLKRYYLENKIWWKRIILFLVIPISKIIYKYGFKQMDIVIANSFNVQTRIRKYLKKDSIIINPPIETDKFKWLNQNDYYLSFARVDKLKRVADIVRAFQKMPDKKLKVVSGGDDFENVKSLAKDFDNIEIFGWVNDSRLVEFIGNSIASIYIPINEDFGMTPLESMSAGKPCIGVNQGGLKETIINKKKVILIPAEYASQDSTEAVTGRAEERREGKEGRDGGWRDQ